MEGYGQGWREPKAKGLARVRQWLREPMTKTMFLSSVLITAAWVMFLEVVIYRDL